LDVVYPPGCVHFCKQPSPLIALPLKPAVGLGVVGMAFPVLPPVLRVLLLPVLLRRSLVLLVIGIGGHFLPLPKPPTHSLALAASAVALIFKSRIEDKQAPTVPTTSRPGRHDAPPSRKRKSIPAKRTGIEARRTRSQIQRKSRLEKPGGRKKENLLAGFTTAAEGLLRQR
jgi:hypothetical protein